MRKVFEVNYDYGKFCKRRYNKYLLKLDRRLFTQRVNDGTNNFFVYSSEWDEDLLKKVETFLVNNHFEYDIILLQG